MLRELPAARKQPLDSISELQKRIRSVEKALRNRGRVVVRCSGIEMLLRIMVEGTDRDEVRTYANEIVEKARTLQSEGKHA